MDPWIAAALLFGVHVVSYLLGERAGRKRTARACIAGAIRAAEELSGEGREEEAEIVRRIVVAHRRWAKHEGIDA